MNITLGEIQIFELKFNLNTYEPKEWGIGMDIHQLRQSIDASGKKLVMLGNEYFKSKNRVVTVSKDKFLVKKCPLSISVQTYRSLFHDRTDGHSSFCLIFDDIS